MKQYGSMIQCPDGILIINVTRQNFSCTVNKLPKNCTEL